MCKPERVDALSRREPVRLRRGEITVTEIEQECGWYRGLDDSSLVQVCARDFLVQKCKSSASGRSL